MRFQACVSGFLALFVSVSLGARLSGELTTRTLGPGTFEVVDHLLVPAGGKLTIAPNTSFAFQGFFEFRVEGNLLARGKPGQEIQFGLEGNPSWMGVGLHGESDSSVFAHCVFRNASSGIHINGGKPWIHHCRFVRNRAGVQCWNRAKPLVNNNDFVMNDDALNNYDSSPYLFNNLFAWNRNWGIWGVREDKATYSHNAFWKNGQGRRAVFQESGSIPVEPQAVWAEMEKDPEFADTGMLEILPSSPLVHAGYAQLTNGANWTLSLKTPPSIGSENIRGEPAKTGRTRASVFVTGLEGNTPNPFNPVTKIRYTVGGIRGQSKPVKVDLSIFSVSGQRIVRLTNKDLEPGNYTAKWNGRDRRGKPVSSGQYFYRLTLPGHVLVRRMTKID